MDIVIFVADLIAYAFVRVCLHPFQKIILFAKFMLYSI